MDKIKKFLYGTSTKRTIMRFVEIFVLAGLSGLAYSVEVEKTLGSALGAAMAAAIVKFARELTDKK